AHGELPVWNPYTFGGYPQLADPQTALFYPVGLLFNLVFARGHLSYALFEWRPIVDYALASLFAYALFWRLSRSVAGGLIGATAWVFGGFLTSYPLPQLPVLETAIWLPLILFALDVALSDSEIGLAAAGVAGVALGCAALAGHTQTLQIGSYAVLAFLIARTLQSRLAVGARLVRVLVFGLVGGGLAGLQFLPTLAFVAESTRRDLSYTDASGGYTLADFRELLLPGGLFQRTYYVGILPLTCAFGALKDSRARFWIGLFLAAAVVALGGHTPIFQMLYRLGPGFASFRDQERAAYAANLALCALASIGTARLLARAKSGLHLGRQLGASVAALLPGLVAAILLFPNGSTPGSSVASMPLLLNLVTCALLIASTIGVVLLCRRGVLSPAAGATVAIVLTATNLLAVGANLNRTQTPPAPASDLVSALDWISQEPGIFRVGNASDGAIDHNVNLLFDIAGTMGDSPIELARSYNLLMATNGYLVDQLFAVRYVVTRQHLGEGFSLEHSVGSLHVYHIQYGLPPAWAVTETKQVSTQADALRETLALKQPGALAVVEDPVALKGAAQPLQQHETWSTWRAGLVRGTVTVSQPALLVISLPYARGWEATVDGSRAVIIRADEALIALPLSAGTHRIVMRYEQPGMRLGIASGAVGAAVLLLAVLASTFQAIRTRSKQMA
ncbi:MAG: YfhO family protein, partial [Chloroflexi bacterium]|nr:YfhO family protein [Chloroflexota bacterium]